MTIVELNSAYVMVNGEHSNNTKLLLCNTNMISCFFKSSPTGRLKLTGQIYTPARVFRKQTFGNVRRYCTSVGPCSPITPYAL